MFTIFSAKIDSDKYVGGILINLMVVIGNLFVQIFEVVIIINTAFLY